MTFNRVWSVPLLRLHPVKSETFTLSSNLPYTLAFIAYRKPGTDSPDFAAVNVLSDVLASQRAKLYELVVGGTALGTEFALAEAYSTARAATSPLAGPRPSSR
ncbi:MAG TPA: hypothetical protein VLT86_09310 [Vicinamibacterales bacterium]|nr:hypothetical protein [Vicinamibacterales bacterium]